MKAKVAFDLDGVFIADSIPDYSDIPGYVRRRNQINKTLFIPSIPYVILTSRLSDDYEHTMDWVNRELSSNPPECVFHSNGVLTTEAAVAYKAGVLNNHYNLQVFVESSREQCDRICGLLTRKVKVICFEDMIHELVSQHCSNLLEG